MQAYMKAALNYATYDILEEGTFCSEIPPCPGVIPMPKPLSNAVKCSLMPRKAGSC